MTDAQTGRSPMIWLWLAVLAVILDQVTKVAAEQLLTFAQPVYLLPVLDFTLLYNKGAAFSFLADQPGWQRWFFTAVSIGVSIMLIVWIKRLPRGAVWLPIALALILGGAIGNLIDRVIYGHVVDFISVPFSAVISFLLLLKLCPAKRVKYSSIFSSANFSSSELLGFINLPIISSLRRALLAKSSS